MSFWRKREPEKDTVAPGDLAEFVCGPNKGRRCLVLDFCRGSEAFNFGRIWHVQPLQALEAFAHAYREVPWPEGMVLSGLSYPHARGRDLRKVDPSELAGKDERDLEAPKDDVREDNLEYLS